MADYFACTRSHHPVRVEKEDSAERDTSLTFGDVGRCLERYQTKSKDWTLVQTEDGSTGWTETARLTSITEEDYRDIRSKRHVVALTTVLLVRDLSITGVCESELLLPFPSRLPNFNKDTRQFQIGDHQFEVLENQRDFDLFEPYANESMSQKKALLLQALKILSRTPYTWGGTNSISGIDCSGLVMSIFNKLLIENQSKLLPRNCSQQVALGREILNLEEAETGDLVFYQRNSRVCHVAIVESNADQGLEAHMAANGEVHSVKLASDASYCNIRDLKFHSIRRPEVFDKKE